MTGTFTIISGNLPPKPPYKHWYFSLKSCFLQTSPVLEGIGRQSLDSFSTKKKNTSFRFADIHAKQFGPFFFFYLFFPCCFVNILSNWWRKRMMWPRGGCMHIHMVGLGLCRNLSPCVWSWWLIPIKCDGKIVKCQPRKRKMTSLIHSLTDKVNSPPDTVTFP